MHQEIPESKRILELNPKHPLIEALFKVYTANENAPELKTYAKVLFDQSLLTEGSPLPDRRRLRRRSPTCCCRGSEPAAKPIPPKNNPRPPERA